MLKMSFRRGVAPANSCVQKAEVENRSFILCDLSGNEHDRGCVTGIVFRQDAQ